MKSTTFVLLFFVAVNVEANKIKFADFGDNDAENNIISFEKDTNRLPRSTSSHITCEETKTKVVIGSDVKLVCCCKPIKDDDVSWSVDGKQMKSSDDQLTLTNVTSQSNVTCSTSDCSGTIIVIVTPTSTNSGVVTFLIILFVALALAVSLCLVKRNKNEFYVCWRDTFCKNSGTDGMVYDSFVSIGKCETNRMVDVLVNDILRKKCGYNLLVDDTNILPQLDYSEKIQTNIHKCRRLLVVFSASYLTNDWCMYCMSEGLRKLVELDIQIIFVVTDYSILRELRAFNDVIGSIPTILLSAEQSGPEHNKALSKIRSYMPSVPKHYSASKGMRSPMLSDVEDIHKRSDMDVSLHPKGGIYKPAKDEVEYRFPPNHNQEEEMDDDAFVTSMETGNDVSPDSIRVREFNARKDLYKLTMTDDLET